MNDCLSTDEEKVLAGRGKGKEKILADQLGCCIGASTCRDSLTE